MSTTTETWWDEVPWADIRPGDVVEFAADEAVDIATPHPIAAVRPGHPSDGGHLGDLKVTLVGADFVTFDRWADAAEPVRCRFPRTIDAAVAS